MQIDNDDAVEVATAVNNKADFYAKNVLGFRMLLQFDNHLLNKRHRSSGIGWNTNFFVVTLLILLMLSC